MNYEQEQKLAAEQAAGQCGANTVDGSELYVGAIGASRPCGSLRDRIHSQLKRAMAQAGKAQQLSELEYLLDKHPDVARILELMEAVGK